MQTAEVRAFKNELRNYNYYLHRIATLDESIEFIYDRLGGVRGIDPSKEPLHSPPDKDLEYKLRDDISRLEANKKLLENKIAYIEQILEKMETSLREAVIKVYAQGKPISVVCNDLYVSPSGLAKKINNEIKKALTFL